MRTVTLNQIGWRIEGVATIAPWGGGESTIPMAPSYVPLGAMTKENLHRCINDNRFGCECILSAELVVYDLFDGGYMERRSDITVRNPCHDLVSRGI